jgi:NitT/TauT family transport system permease protein
LGNFPEQLFPAPHQVLSQLLLQIKDVRFWGDVSISLYRVIIGFTLAAVFGFVIGILMGYYKKVDVIYTPLNNFIRYLPVPSLVPLLMLLFGTGDLEKFIVIFIGTFFQVTLLIRDDIHNLDKGYIEAAMVMGLKNDYQLLTRVVVPARLPYILDDLKVGLGWAWSYLLVAEIVAAQKGIGFKIMQANRFLQTSKIVSFIFIIGLSKF